MRFRLIEDIIDYNANPYGKNEGDCSIRALSLAYNQNYNQVKSELKKNAQELKTEFNSEASIEKYINDHKFIEFIDETKMASMNVGKFAQRYRHGTYVVFCSDRIKQDVSHSFHLVTVSDGEIFDTWDSSEYYVIKAWHINNYNTKAKSIEKEQ